MFEEIDDWARKNIECCACGGSLETSEFINVVELKKVAIWKFPVFGHIDVPDYEPRALAIICDECRQNKVKIQRCIEWEGTPYQVKYHDVDGLKDCNGMSQIDYYFGKLFRRRQLLKKAASERGVN